jgi:hypothetical protein
VGLKPHVAAGLVAQLRFDILERLAHAGKVPRLFEAAVPSMQTIVVHIGAELMSIKGEKGQKVDFEMEGGDAC